MNILLTIILLIGISICIFIVTHTTKKNTEIELENKKRLEKLERLRIEQTAQEQNLVLLKNNINTLNNSIQEKNEELNRLHQQSINSLEVEKQLSEQAFDNYFKTLDQQYDKTDKEYAAKVQSCEKELSLVQADLDKMREMRAAAQQALLKEQEIKENKDNYRLIPTDADLADIKTLERVKRQLNKPRILSMLIWQTYWQPIAKRQFPIIIKAKTATGIYKITNIITEQCYIGQAIDIYKRWSQHAKCGLGIDTPPGNKLYKAIQEYGLENFTFEVLTECNSTELDEKEKYFISLYQADIFGYNGTKGND